LIFTGFAAENGTEALEMTECAACFAHFAARRNFIEGRWEGLDKKDRPDKDESERRAG